MTEIAISIVNYLRDEATAECVRSLILEEQRGGGHFRLEIFVTDNGSVPECQARLKTALSGHPNVHLRPFKRNTGFAAGHNRNLREIFNNHQPDYVWLLNNDCIALPGCISALSKCAAKDPQVAIWGATLLEDDGNTVQCAGGCFYNSWLSSYHQFGRGQATSRIEELHTPVFDYISGASMFFPSETLVDGLSPARTGRNARPEGGRTYLNEEFFLYFEELDLAKRLRPASRTGWCREAKIRHAGGLATGAKGGNRTAQAEYHSTLSALKFTSLYYPGRLWITIPTRFLAKLVQLIFAPRMALFAAIGRAYMDFFRWLWGNPGRQP
jgi:GT2 family glycosyltransferase